MNRGDRGLILSRRADRLRRLGGLFGHGLLLAVTSSSIIAVLFIFFFIAKDALPFFRTEGLREFFTQVAWYPTEEPPAFGALAIFFGTAMVTVGSIIVAVPLGLAASLCLSDILPFALRQLVKPIIELLAAIPSVAYGFVAMVVLAPLLQEQGGRVLAVAAWIVGTPLAAISVIVLSDVAGNAVPKPFRKLGRIVIGLLLGLVAIEGLATLSGVLSKVQIVTGVNALNASVILGIMALPTIISVAEDALQAVGRELREGSYALGATRAETLVKVVIPAAASGICAAVILGIMRAVGETMVVLMAAGGASHIPEPWYNFFASVRTMTATIAAEMGEADQSTGSAHYHALFALALSLLVISFVLNMLSEWAVHRAQKKLRGE
ncbi:MAG TPA: PstC family ABC transporter permease [Thermoguttaceae bacterium]|nr:PstC family ABC transporter permease [Thermoguttaceae bacterium]